MRKQKKHIRFSARAAIALLLLSLLTLTGWRDIAIYFGARSGNTEAITEECVNIQIGRTDELRQHTPYRGLYVLTLKNGTNLAVYLDDAKSPFSSAAITGLFLQYANILQAIASLESVLV